MDFGSSMKIFLPILFLLQAQAKELSSCGGKPADVFFILDSSGSLTVEDFQKELRFTEDVASMFDIGDDKVRVGVLSFSKTVDPKFGLGEYVDRTDMIRKISEVTYEGMGTNTGEALSYLHEKGMSSKKVRPDIPHVAIVLTDGMSQDVQNTLRQAQYVHDAGISVFVIAIGAQVDKMELEAIASRPSRNYVFLIDNFDALNHIKEELAIKTCEVKAATSAVNIQNTQADVEKELEIYGSCTPQEPLDIVFAVDTVAVGSSNTKLMFQFIANISSRLNMVVGDTRIATIGNGCGAMSFDEKPATDPEQLKKSFSAYETPLFDQLIKNMRLKAANGRSNSKHIGIVFISDPISPSEYRNAKLEIMRAQFQKTTMFLIAVGDRVNESQMRSLVTSDRELFKSFSFANLKDISSVLLFRLCLFGMENI